MRNRSHPRNLTTQFFAGHNMLSRWCMKGCGAGDWAGSFWAGVGSISGWSPYLTYVRTYGRAIPSAPMFRSHLFLQSAGYGRCLFGKCFRKPREPCRQTLGAQIQTKRGVCTKMLRLMPFPSFIKHSVRLRSAGHHQFWCDGLGRLRKSYHLFGVTNGVTPFCLCDRLGHTILFV